MRKISLKQPLSARDLPAGLFREAKQNRRTVTAVARLLAAQPCVDRFDGRILSADDAAECLGLNRQAVYSALNTLMRIGFLRLTADPLEKAPEGPVGRKGRVYYLDGQLADRVAGLEKGLHEGVLAQRAVSDREAEKSA